MQKTCLPYFFFVLLQTDYIIMFNDEKDIYQSWIFKAALFLGIAYLLVSCQVGKTQAGDNMDAGDTIPMKYAQHLTMVKHGEEYTEVILANPWKEGTLLHRYILVPKGQEGNETVTRLALRRASAARCATDTVRTPVTSSVVDRKSVV